MTPFGVIPATEGQARALARIADPVERETVWQGAQASHGPQPSARQISHYQLTPEEVQELADRGEAATQLTLARLATRTAFQTLGWITESLADRVRRDRFRSRYNADF